MRIVEQKCDCSIQIMPIADYPEYSTLYNPTWKDSGVLTLIYKVSVDGTQELIDKITSLHYIDGKPQREVYNTSLPDGWYKIVSLVVPTKLYLQDLGMVDGFEDREYQSMHQDTENDLNNTMIIVAADENSITGFSFTGRLQNPSPYKNSNLYYWQEVTDINDLIDEYLNREIIDEHLEGTNIKVTVEDYFTYCNLNKCFINKATSLLDQYKGCSNNGFSICSDSKVKCKSNVDEYSIQIRDYLWMTLLYWS